MENFWGWRVGWRAFPSPCRVSRERRYRIRTSLTKREGWEREGGSTQNAKEKAVRGLARGGAVRVEQGGRDAHRVLIWTVDNDDPCTTAVEARMLRDFFLISFRCLTPTSIDKIGRQTNESIGGARKKTRNLSRLFMIFL